MEEVETQCKTWQKLSFVFAFGIYSICYFSVSFGKIASAAEAQIRAIIIKLFENAMGKRGGEKDEK